MTSVTFFVVLVICTMLKLSVVTTQTSETPLLVSKFYSIIDMPLSGGVDRVLANGPGCQPGIYNVDFHFEMEKIFWVDYNLDTLYQADFDGCKRVPLVYNINFPNINKPRGLAVDWINDKVYFSYADPDPASSPTNLAVYDIGTSTTTIIMLDPATQSNLKVYYELAVDPCQEPCEGKLYWSNGHSLIMGSISGVTIQNVQLVYNSPCLVMYLTLIGDKLYFTQDGGPGCTASNQGVFCYDLDPPSPSPGTSPKTSIHTGIGTYRGVTAYGSNVIWAGHDTVYEIPADGSGSLMQIEQFSGSGISLRGITVIDSSLQPQS